MRECYFIQSVKQVPLGYDLIMVVDLDKFWGIIKIEIEDFKRRYILKKKSQNPELSQSKGTKRPPAAPTTGGRPLFPEFANNISDYENSE